MTGKAAMGDRTIQVQELWNHLYEEGGAETIRAILDIDPGQATAAKYGVTLLHIAAGSAYINEIRLLLKMGADVNAIDSDGKTPLHRAAHTRNPDVCRFLLQHGALKTVQDSQGRTPAYYATVGDVWASPAETKETIDLLA